MSEQRLQGLYETLLNMDSLPSVLSVLDSMRTYVEVRSLLGFKRKGAVRITTRQRKRSTRKNRANPEGML